MKGGGGRARVHLGIGELHATARPTRISMVLGSCVSLTMHSPRIRAGAACHAALPNGTPGDLRYVDAAVRQMVEWFARLGVEPVQIETKLFGGGNMFRPESNSVEYMEVGRRNIESARAVIAREGLNLVSGHVGGRRGRSLVFFTDTGEAFMRGNRATALGDERRFFEQNRGALAR